jgi:hypothetical protein
MVDIITTPDSDQLHNQNAYAYLQQLAANINDITTHVFPRLADVVPLVRVTYDDKVAYGDYYSNTLRYLEDNIDSIYPTLKGETLNKIDDLIFAIYHNDNHILEQGAWLNQIHTHIRPRYPNTNQLISRHLEDPPKRINYHSPCKAGGLVPRFTSLFSANFKPQLDTNIPSVKHRSYSSDLDAVEYRAGTQAQRHQGEVRISPLFRHWLLIKAKRSPKEKPIAHVYFNNLGLNRSFFDIPGTNEKKLTIKLHQLENDPALKIAVITLPASQGLIASDDYKKTEAKLAYNQVFNELYHVAYDEFHQAGVVDFKISPDVKRLLFTTKENEVFVLKELLTKSFLVMGINEGYSLSTSQKQAVWLHFIKYELTHYILTTLQPESFNFSCKDAIDRGALSSLYFNLHESFTSKQPMSRNQFENDLDVAAANVKARGMNFHRLILWNAIDHYVTTHYDILKDDSKKSWLIYWRDMSCPHARVSELLDVRLKQYEALLQSLPLTQEQTKIYGLKLVEELRKEHKNKISGQRLLLEVVSRSALLVTEKPTKDSIDAYKNLAEELKINHPTLCMIGGFMLTVLGLLLFSKSLSYKGIANMKASFFARERHELCQDMLAHIADVEETLIMHSPPDEEDLLMSNCSTAQ